MKLLLLICAILVVYAAQETSGPAMILQSSVAQNVSCLLLLFLEALWNFVTITACHAGLLISENELIWTRFALWSVYSCFYSEYTW